jgi:aryl-alcohol dehydrogenase-like predicted oxidoreductase
LNTWDTSCSHSNGVSQEIFSKAIRQYNIPPHKLIILTKCYNTFQESNTEELLELSKKRLEVHPDELH